MNKKIITILIIIALLVLGTYLYIRSYYSVSTVYPYERCDLDQNMNCDDDDLNIFMESFESCSGDNNFNSFADVDGSGCITVDDKQYLFPEQD